jgi:hypothetical protein
MTPGLHVSSYGRFPVEVDTDPASIQNLDVFYKTAMTTGCGVENSSRSILEGMGSNMVGGKKRTTYRNKKAVKAVKAAKKSYTRKQSKKMKMKKSKLSKKGTRSYKGGSSVLQNLGDSLAARPYVASVPPNTIQGASSVWNGSIPQVPFPSSPAEHSWSYISNGLKGVIPPTTVSHIGNNFQTLANPAPWTTTN